MKRWGFMFGFGDDAGLSPSNDREARAKRPAVTRSAYCAALPPVRRDPRLLVTRLPRSRLCRAREAAGADLVADVVAGLRFEQGRDRDAGGLVAGARGALQRLAVQHQHA